MAQKRNILSGYRLLAIIMLVITFVPVSVLAGEGKITPRKAAELYRRENYAEALEYYKYLVKADERNIQYQIRLGVCYLKTNIDKGLAIPYFETAIDLDRLDNVTNYAIAYYLLGKALHYDEQYDKAIETFQLFSRTGKYHGRRC